MNGEFSNILLAWFADYGRDLPWRHTSDPYAIWLSEIILQQTRVQQGKEYWERFMAHFPTVERLAAATEDEVLRLWQGLGYYSRARNLHKAACQIVEYGQFPSTLEAIRQLSGVGDYTAAAVASISFGQDAAAVDGNVYRVLSRYYGISTPINTSEGKREFAALAQQLLPKGHAGTFNQALMDFGALQCTPRSPRCIVCPLVESCVAARTGQVDVLPVKLSKTKVKERHLAYIYIRCNGCVALHRRSEGDIWQGLWEPVLLVDDMKSLSEPIPEGAQLLASQMKHVLTHRILLADFYFLECPDRPTLHDDYVWVEESELDNYAKPRLIERLLEML